MKILEEVKDGVMDVVFLMALGLFFFAGIIYGLFIRIRNFL